MSAQNWSKTAGEVAGKITGVWFGAAIAVVVLIVPTKLIVVGAVWFWNLF